MSNGRTWIMILIMKPSKSVNRTPHMPRSHSRSSTGSNSGSHPDQRVCRSRSQGRPAPIVLPSPPRRSDSEPVLDRSRSSSPTRDYLTTPLWKWQLKTLPANHSKFIKDIVSFINGKESLCDFAFGSGIPSHTVRKAIRDNDPLDTELAINDSVAQSLTVWWLSSNKPPLWKSNKIRQGFDLLGMPGVYCCILARNPTMDPNPTWGNIKNMTQSSAVQAQDGRPQQYLSLEYIMLCLKLNELGLLTDLSELIDTPENTLALVMNTKMHEDTFAYIHKEHRRFSLENTLVQHRIAYHILATWYILENEKSDKIPY